ncbi:MAG: hypothetical protein GY895_03480, partial [Phycisphaera sp.]|nr:hypothetical protein [Phycisphaera sp.]
MPSITFDSRSLLVSGRRPFIMGAGLEYPSMLPEAWGDRLHTLRDLGFNTVMSACPWLLHEPVQGHSIFDGRLDLSRYLQSAADVGMSVVLKIGPVVGPPYDGGGLPTWLQGDGDFTARSGAPEFMNLASHWFATLAERMVSFQADQDGGGPLLAVQIEHDWRCGSEEAARKYLLELTRFARERGVTVPILTSNGFWSPIENAIETWSGWDDLFMNVRQVGGLQPDRPRICIVDRSTQESGLRRPGIPVAPSSGRDLENRIMQVVAAGGQPILGQAVAGRLPVGAVGRDGFGPIAPDPFVDVLIDEHGCVTDLGEDVGRFARFVRDFPSLLADLDPDDHPMVPDPQDTTAPVLVPRRGGAGSVAFAVRGDESRKTTVVDGDGRRFTIDFDGQSLDWRIFDVDLAGQGRLDYASATPLALTRNLLLLSAPPRSDVEVSIDGRPLAIRTPEGRGGLFAPIVERHGDIMIVLVATRQGTGVCETESGLFVGADSVDGRGDPIPVRGCKQIHEVTWDGKVRPAKPSLDRSHRSRKPSDWSVWHEPDPRRTDHPRSIMVDEDLGLASINAGIEHAWFTAPIEIPDARLRRL